MTQGMNLAVGANFDLLKTNLAAVIEKDQNGMKILLTPTKVESPVSVTFEDMKNDLKRAFQIPDEDLGKISNNLNDLGKDDKAGDNKKNSFDIGKMKFQLQSAFFYKDSPKEGDGTNEYAFAIAVDTSEALPDLGFIKLNGLFFAIWNTEREGVLRQIGTGTITKMLSNLDA